MIASPVVELVVVQPTPFCNLDCAYCYLPKRNDPSRMTQATVDAIARNLLASGLVRGEVTFVWHAGEPLVVPPAWYEDAFTRLAASAPTGVAIRQAVQTNGVLLDAAWCALFARWQVVVGVSLDGPAEIHDARRRTRRGGGSFADTLRGVRTLQTHGHPFHVITVLGTEGLRDPDRLIDFYLEQGVTDVCFNVEEIEGAHRHSSLSGGDAHATYAAFLRRVAARLRERPGQLRCREVDAFVRLAASPREMRRHNPQVRPLAIVSIAVDGSMSTFSPELLGVEAPAFANFAFANVHDVGPQAILHHARFRALHGEIQRGVEECRRTCRYFDVCGGGAPANKWFEHGSFAATETLYCRLTRQAVVDALLPELEADARVA